MREGAVVSNPDYVPPVSAEFAGILADHSAEMNAKRRHERKCGTAWSGPFHLVRDCPMYCRCWCHR